MNVRLRMTVVAVAFLAGGCDPATAPTPLASPAPPPALATRPRTAELIRGLQGAGLTARFAELMQPQSHPFVSVPAVRIAVDGENVYAFEFETTAAAEAEARGISSDGYQVGTAHVDWISDPHFHRSDRLIALYVGRSDRIRAALERLLGPQFAGRQ